MCTTEPQTPEPVHTNEPNTAPTAVFRKNRKRAVPDDYICWDLVCDQCKMPLTVTDIHRSHKLYQCAAANFSPLDYNTKKKPRRALMIDRLADLAHYQTRKQRPPKNFQSKTSPKKLASVRGYIEYNIEG